MQRKVHNTGRARAGYILHNGLQQPPEKRSRFKLFLSCTLVVTSVIPPDLPMQLTMAVNNSLLALRKKGIFCTEPFRIPYAGKIEVCCFDKTGTLTSDNMVLRGVSAAPGMAQAAPTAESPAPEPVADRTRWPHVRPYMFCVAPVDVHTTCSWGATAWARTSPSLGRWDGEECQRGFACRRRRSCLRAHSR